MEWWYSAHDVRLFSLMLLLSFQHWTYKTEEKIDKLISDKLMRTQTIYWCVHILNESQLSRNPYKQLTSKIYTTIWTRQKKQFNICKLARVQIVSCWELLKYIGVIDIKIYIYLAEYFFFDSFLPQYFIPFLLALWQPIKDQESNFCSSI